MFADAGDAGEVWALASAGSTWQLGTRTLYRWNGTAWFTLPLPKSAPFLRDVWRFGKDDLLLSSEDALYRWTDGAWQAIPRGTQKGFMALWGDTTTVWGASEGGAIISYRMVR